MIRWHATYYLNYTAYWCNAKISALLSIGVPTPQLVYTIPETAIFPHWYNASWQRDSMSLWVLAICHKAMLFAKGKILSLCVSIYTLCSKAENHLHIPRPCWYTHRLLWGLKLKLLFYIEGTHISKYHVIWSTVEWTCCCCCFSWMLHPHPVYMAFSHPVYSNLLQHSQETNTQLKILKRLLQHKYCQCVQYVGLIKKMTA